MSAAPSKTTVDWFKFRTRAEVRPAFEAVRPLFGRLGESMSLVSVDRARDGFEQACEVRFAGDVVMGRVDFGGKQMRGWARWDFPGRGCEWIEKHGDWQAIEGVESLAEAEIRRLDVALTTWQGEVTHEAVEAAHTAGLFCVGGRPPELRQVISSNPRAGRTNYVGARTSPKFFRGYEKGFELAGKLGALGESMTEIEGHPLEDIYRCEIELKAVDGCDVGWESIGCRDQVFAGSYPFLAELLPDVVPDVFMRRPEREPELELQAALANCKHQFGRTLFTALHAYEGDIGAVFARIVGDRHNEDLLAAGVMHFGVSDALPTEH